MSGLHFAEPGWVHLLWAVLALVAVLAWLERRGGDALDRFVSHTLRSRLTTRPRRAQRVARLAFLAAALVFLTLALMRPQWGLELARSQRAGAEIMICLDVSRSMLAEDAAPNRLERAKAEIRDLLELLPGDQVGLIAFAGRATVLSPLTPDFGFLRLALDEAGPGSVGRGGTRLEEPIRKAIAGFGDVGEVSRAILLITDGEDHDSFPMEAAKAAAERGIRILAIGFGAETGAEIPITSPRTGARTVLTDADGRVVRSRLDGDLLRDMALATGGAYIPAGTGVLDLGSIYRRHVAPLTRGQMDGRTRAVRNDVFQWAVLLAMLALLGSVLSTARVRGPAPRETDTAAITALGLGLSLMAVVMLSPVTTLAQQPPVQATGAEAAETTTSPDSAEAALPQEPRIAYNQGLEHLDAGDLETATRLLEAARAGSATDGEVRFRATYNLAWTEVKAADAVLETAPEQALERLRHASAWFRDALQLRPSHEDTRYNLEQVLRRALALSDALAAGKEGDLLKDLNTLIAGQREFLTALRAGVAAQQAGEDGNVAPELRRLFRGLATRELTLLGDIEQLAQRAARELAGLRGKPESQRTPEEALRSARLEAVVGHLHQARQRIAQTRSRLRRVQGERAYRRAAAGLGALGRARDQLLDPVARLDALLGDGIELTRLTAVMASSSGPLSADTPATPPQWLTSRYLQEAQSRLDSRTAELHTLLTAGLEAPAGEAAAQEPAQAAQRARLMASLGEATPLVGTAREHFQAAGDALSRDQPGEALGVQRLGLEALAAARERFLDLRRLIELVYAREQQLRELIAEPTDSGAAGEASPPAPDAIAAGAALQVRNLERAQRLGRMLSDAMTAPAPEAGPSTPAASGQNERLERGYSLLGEAMTAMHAADDALADAAASAAQPLAEARSAVSEALTHLSELRRLFFSVLEHLQETAQRQQELSDETETLAVLEDPAGEPDRQALGPLAHRQRGLAATAAAIGDALQAQAQPPDAPAPGAQQPDPERLQRAAQLVDSAGERMGKAASDLDIDPPPMAQARNAQDEALDALGQAIALLRPPQDPQQQNQDQDQSQRQEQEQSGQGEGQGQPQPQPGAGQADLARLLQGVRDREARRRADRARAAARQGYEPVEKDW